MLHDSTLEITLEIMLNQRSWSAKTTYFIIPFTLNAQTQQTFRDGKLVVPRGWMSGDTGT